MESTINNIKKAIRDSTDCGMKFSNDIFKEKIYLFPDHKFINIDYDLIFEDLSDTEIKSFKLDSNYNYKYANIPKHFDIISHISIKNYLFEWSIISDIYMLPFQSSKNILLDNEFLPTFLLRKNNIIILKFNKKQNNLKLTLNFRAYYLLPEDIDNMYNVFKYDVNMFYFFSLDKWIPIYDIGNINWKLLVPYI